MIINRRQFLKATALELFAGAALLQGQASGMNTAISRPHPNILFIMSDDHTWQALGVYKSILNSLNPTPNLDRLARNGMLFDNALCTNSICTPSRACIMTGQYSHINGCLTLGERLPEQQQHLAREMKKAGYQTAVIGKWHLKERPSAFDYYKVLPGQGSYFDPVFFESGVEDKIKMTGHSTDCITESALNWFKKSRNPDKPFFLKLHFKAPHDMFDYAPRYEKYLENVKIPEPDSMYKRGSGSVATRGHNGELDRIIGTSIGRRNLRRSYYKQWVRDETLTDDQALSEAYQIYLKRYLRCVKGVDDNVKRVLDYLKTKGLLENTVIFYTGDQGFFLGEHDYQDKRWGYEPSLRVPLFVHYPPTIKAGMRSDAIVENVDYPVTILDFAGVKRPDYMQGWSFRQILETSREPNGWKQEGYYQYWMHMAHHDNPAHIALRTKNYKLMLFYGTSSEGFGRARTKVPTPPAWELYDLKKDPNEMDNVYDDPAYAEIVKDLKERFKTLRHRIKADDPSAAPNKKVCEEMKAVNQVIDEYWDYDEQDLQRAIQISHEYLKKFGQ